MSANLAVVDDDDLRVVYSGGWDKAGSSEEFASTTHCSTTVGSTASFTFVGTSVTVYGTYASNSILATFSFVLDNSPSGQGTFTPPANTTSDVHHFPFFNSGTLTNASHTLVIRQTAVDTRCILFLDFITYTPTTGGASTYFVDDRDTNIVYQPAWSMFGAEQDFMHTSQSSPSAGAKLTYTFEGRGISYYGGDTAGNKTKASIALDGGPPTIFVPPPTAGVVNNKYYDSGVLADGKHTLVVTAVNDDPIWVDYLLVVPPLISASSPSPPTSSSTTTTTGSAGAGGTSSTTTSSAGAGGTSTTSTRSAGASGTSSPDTNPVHRSSSSKAGPIAGGVIGGIFLLVCVAFLALFCVRRRQRRQDGIITPDMSQYQSSVTRPGASQYPSNVNVDVAPSASAYPFPMASSLHANDTDSQAFSPYTSESHLSPGAAGSIVSSAGVAGVNAVRGGHHPAVSRTLSAASGGDTRSAYNGIAPSTSTSQGHAHAQPEPPLSRDRKLANEARFHSSTRRSVGGASEMEGPPTYIE
ncbi:hypothetical protein C8F01DRAFT_1157632 [Mycena amicta]|nr:hypothetical protein C8F01DRAFT_1157632 [Mycena amicta]